MRSKFFIVLEDFHIAVCFNIMSFYNTLLVSVIFIVCCKIKSYAQYCFTAVEKAVSFTNVLGL